MKTLNKIALLAAPLAFSLTTAAQAQQADITDQKPFSVQVGPGFLTGGKATSLYSTTGLHLGASYALPIQGLEASGLSTAVDLDFNYNSGSHGHLDSTGLTFVGRIPLTQNNSGRSVIPYAGLGIGAWDTMVKYRTTHISDTTTVEDIRRHPAQASGGGGSGGSSSGGSSSGGGSTTTTTNYSKCGVQIGGKLLLGLAFQGGYFTELSYTISGSKNGVSPDSINLAAGIRF